MKWLLGVTRLVQHHIHFYRQLNIACMGLDFDRYRQKAPISTSATARATMTVLATGRTPIFGAGSVELFWSNEAHSYSSGDAYSYCDKDGYVCWFEHVHAYWSWYAYPCSSEQTCSLRVRVNFGAHPYRDAQCYLILIRGWNKGRPTRQR